MKKILCKVIHINLSENKYFYFKNKILVYKKIKEKIVDELEWVFQKLNTNNTIGK